MSGRSSLILLLSLVLFVPASAATKAADSAKRPEASPAVTQSTQGKTIVMLTKGVFWQGKVVSMDEKRLRLATAKGREVSIPRDDIAFINFCPDWLAIRAYGTLGNVFYNYGAGYALPLPAEGWQVLSDSQGHIFLQHGALTIGIYGYAKRYANLDAFLAAHARYRAGQGMPEGSYKGGEKTLLAGREARAFTYQTTVNGNTLLLTDIKAVGPLGQGCVVSFSASGISREAFEAAKREAMPVVQRLRFLTEGQAPAE